MAFIRCPVNRKVGIFHAAIRPGYDNWTIDGAKNA
jgi:hypothetical protein